MTVSLSLRLLEQRLAHDAAAAELVTQVREELAAALVEVRELSGGLHPAVLADHGLAPAPAALAARVPLVRPGVAAARVGRATGRGARGRVADDGVGGTQADGGSGLRGLADRLEAVGGRLDMSSPVGGGTRIAAAIPY